MKKISLFWLMVFVSWSLSGCGGGDKKSSEKKPAEIVVGADVAMRACELLVNNTDAATLDTVVFKDGVVGAFKKRGDRAAIAFVAKEDVAIAADAVVVSMSKGVVSGLKLDTAKSRCFNGKGEEMPNILWALQD